MLGLTIPKYYRELSCRARFPCYLALEAILQLSLVTTPHKRE